MYYSQQYINYFANCNHHQTQILKACQAHGARIILSTWPKRHAARLNDYPFIYAIRARPVMGLEEFLKLSTHEPPACAACTTRHNHRAVPEHFTSCPTTHQQTHQAVITEIYSCLKAAGISQVEIERNVGDNLRVDIMMRDPAPANPQQPYYMIDPTIIQSYNANDPTDIPDTNRKLKQANTKKKTTYAHAALAHSATVVPLAFTSLGAYHYEFTSFLQRTARTASATGNYFPSTDGSFTNFWKTNILFTLARATAKSASEAAWRHRLAMV